VFFVLSLPIALFGVGAALGRYNGRAMFTYILPMAAFVSAPRVRVFKREPNTQAIMVGSVKTRGSKQSLNDQESESESMESEPAESRLKKLAYLLDSKSRQATDIIGNDQDEAIIVPTATPKAHAGPSVLSQLKNSLLTKSQSKSPVQTKLKPIQPMRSVSGVPSIKPTKKVPTQRKKFDPNSIFN
jgi:hypothetical protein